MRKRIGPTSTSEVDECESDDVELAETKKTSIFFKKALGL